MMHEIDYTIIGDDMQIVEIELDPGETVIAEAGVMNYMDEGIRFETKMGDGSNPRQGFLDKALGAGKRLLTGESLFMTHFTNDGNEKQCVAFAAPYPGKIILVDLALTGGEFICQKDAFLCAAMGTNIEISFNKKLSTGLFGGEGFILQKLTGTGKAFIHVGGTVIKKELEDEKILVDTGCIAGFTPGIEYEIQKTGSMKTMLFGGEGLFLASLSGHGTVYLQSLPFSRLARRIIQQIPQSAGSKGEGSVLGGLGKALMGGNT
jgi:uncharacterized protein (TIGR00266 family)